MTARHPVNVGESDLLLAKSTVLVESESSQPLAQNLSHDSSEMSEALTSLMGGLSGLALTLSLIFFLQAPLISCILLLVTASGWGGAAIHQAYRDSSSNSEQVS